TLLFQDAELDPGADDLDAGLTTVSQSGAAGNRSDGTATVHTGAVRATGNESTTQVHQAIDPTGVSIQTQVAGVVNAGIGVASSGVNGAVGNGADNGPGDGAFLTQSTLVGPGAIDAGVVTVANQGETTNTSDGTASVTTGAATSVGNHSDTTATQTADATSDA